MRCIVETSRRPEHGRPLVGEVVDGGEASMTRGCARSLLLRRSQHERSAVLVAP